MFEFIGFMLGIQYGEKVFNLLGVLFRGAVAILSFFAWLSAWDLLTQYLYISTMYKIIAIALMVLFVVSLCFCAYRAEVKNEHYSKIFPAVWYLITLAVMYFPDKEINGAFYFLAVLELFEIYIPKKFLEMEERRKKKSILVENAEFIIHEYLMKIKKK